ncbi:MAG: ABC transporter permease [Treponema sp.]|jgi:simple sugar transport system permease protein|nr:ABC transporter permease [Treponema sp.]
MLHSAITIMTPLLFAATGGLFTELAGMLNIALEGLLLTGAFSAIVCSYFTGSTALGVIAAVLASGSLAALLGAVTLKLRANVFIAGLAANLFAGGVTVVLSFRIFASRGVLSFNQIPRLKNIVIPGISGIPVLGDIFSNHSFYVYAGWIFLLAAWILLYKTPFGFHLRACEKHQAALVSLGLRPDRYRFAGFLISGLACGLGGSYLTLNLGAFVPNISSGKGWTALVIIFLGSRRPAGILAGTFAFGLAEAFSNYAQGALNAPADFILAIPSFFTLLLMIAVSMYTKRKQGFM